MVNCFYLSLKKNFIEMNITFYDTIILILANVEYNKNNDEN